MHGSNQGSNLLRSLCDEAVKPDVIFLQEHWLTPANLPKLVNFSSNYTMFGISAMESALCHGILSGRPWGGVSTLLKSSSCKDVIFSVCKERFVLLILSDSCFLNIYLPSANNSSELDVLLALLTEIDGAIINAKCNFSIHNTFVGGDMNINFKLKSRAAAMFNEFVNRWGVTACKDIITPNLNYTYCNEALKHYSLIDYIFLSNYCWLRYHVIIDSAINLANVAATYNTCTNLKNNFAALDWNKNACSLYYELTRVKMQNIYELIVELQGITNEHTQSSNTATNALYNDFDNNRSEFNISCTDSIEQLYSNIVDVLSLCSSEAVPKVVSRGAKFWWDSTLQNFKIQSVRTHA